MLRPFNLDQPQVHDMKGNTIVSAGQAWGPSTSLVSRKPAGEGQPFLTLESYLSSPTYAVTIWDRGVRLGEGCHSPSSSLRWVTREIGGRKSDRFTLIRTTGILMGG